jgi:hypothetical protein
MLESLFSDWPGGSAGKVERRDRRGNELTDMVAWPIDDVRVVGVAFDRRAASFEAAERTMKGGE